MAIALKVAKWTEAFCSSARPGGGLCADREERRATRENEKAPLDEARAEPI